jgi:hypothetical protein
VPDHHILFVEQYDQFLRLDVTATDKRADIRNEIFRLRRATSPAVNPNVGLCVGKGAGIRRPVYAFDVASRRFAVNDIQIDGIGVLRSQNLVSAAGTPSSHDRRRHEGSCNPDHP